jgi:hypothetical protein
MYDRRNTESLTEPRATSKPDQRPYPRPTVGCHFTAIVLLPNTCQSLEREGAPATHSDLQHNSLKHSIRFRGSKDHYQVVRQRPLFRISCMQANMLSRKHIIIISSVPTGLHSSLANPLLLQQERNYLRIRSTMVCLLEEKSALNGSLHDIQGLQLGLFSTCRQLRRRPASPHSFCGNWGNWGQWG